MLSKKCLHFHWVCNHPITDHHSIIATLERIKERHSCKDLARTLHNDSPRGLAYTFNLSKCAAPRTSGFATPANCSPHSWETGDRWGKPKKICIRVANNGTKTLLLCRLHYVPLCFDWGLWNTSPSKLNATSSLSTALILTLFCVEVSTWVCVRDWGPVL